MAISDLSTVSAKHPRSVVRSRGTTSKLFSITTRIAATAVFALGAFAAAAMLPASNANAQAPDPNDDSTLASAVVGPDGETGTTLIFSGTPPTATTISVGSTVTRLRHVLTATDTSDPGDSTTGATIALCEVNDPSNGTGDPVNTGTGSFTWGSNLTSLRDGGGGAGDYAFRVLVRSENAVDAIPPNCNFLTNDQVNANPAITAYFYTVTVEPAPTPAAAFTRGNGTIAAGRGTSTFSVALTDIPATADLSSVDTAVAAVGVQLSFGGSTNDAASGDPRADLDVELVADPANGELITSIGSGGTATFFMNYSDFQSNANTLIFTVITTDAEEGEVFVVTVDDIILYDDATRSVLDAGTAGVLTDTITIAPVAGDDKTFTVGPAATPPSTVSIGVAGDATTIPETAGILAITVSLDVPATDQITLPITFGGGVNDATLLMSGGDSGSFDPSDADYAVYSTECSGAESDEAGSRYCATGDDLVFESGQQTKTLTVRAIADGTDSTDVDETITITLNEVASGGITVPANTSVTVTIESPDFDLINPTNRRLEIGGVAGSVTLQIQNFHFPAESASAESPSTDILVVPVSLNQLFTPDGRAPSPNFPRINNPARPKNANQGQEISGDFIRLSLPNPRGLTGANRPYFLAQNSSAVRLVVPQALLAENGNTDSSLGTQPAIGAEDIIININAIDNENAETGDFDWTMGIAGGVYPGVSTEGLVTFTARRGDRFGALTPNGDTRIGYSIARASADNPLPRTMNPATQDVLKASITSNRFTRAQDGGVITIALPGITAPPNAVKGEIVLDVNSKTTVDDVTVSPSTHGGSVGLGTVGNGRLFALRVPGVNNGRQTTLGFPDSTDQDISLSFVATPRQPIRGSVTLRVIPSNAMTAMIPGPPPIPAMPLVMDNDNVTFTASSIIFRNSAGKEINAAGEEVADFEFALPASALENENNVAEVNAVSIGARTSILDGLVVGGVTLRGSSTPNLLSESGTALGAGLAEIPFVDTETPVAVVMTLADSTPPGPTSGDSTTVAGTGGLTVTAPDALTAMVQGFNPGMNTFTIAVADTDNTGGIDATRIYTISVIVPPAPPDTNDSTLRSVTVNGGLVGTGNFGADPATVGAITGTINVPGVLPLITAVEIVATSSNASARVLVCSVDTVANNGSGALAADPALVTAVPDADTPNRFRILVFAVDDATSTPPTLDCGATTTTVAGDGDVDEYFLTVTVEAVPNDATIDIAATTLDPTMPDTSAVSVRNVVYTRDANDNVIAGPATADVVLPAGTAEGALVITAAANGARVISIDGTDLGTPVNTATAALTGIANEGTITFTVRAENDDTEIDYTLTFIVQDARLNTATFGGAPIALVDTDNSLPLESTGSIGNQPTTITTTGGNLILTLADTDDTIESVSGSTEGGREVSVNNMDDYTSCGAGNCTVTLSDMAVGTNTLTVVVRPEHGRDTGEDAGADDRTYALSIPVLASGVSGGIEAIGDTVVPPNVPAMFNVFLIGFPTDGTIDHARVVLDFGGTAFALDESVDENVVSGREFSNDRYKVKFPNTTDNTFFGVDGSSPQRTVHVTAGRIHFRTRTDRSDFIDDGTIYMPITITPLPPDETTNVPPVPRTETIRVVSMGGYSGGGTVSAVETVTPTPSSIRYTVTDGPPVSFTTTPSIPEDTADASATPLTLTIGSPGTGSNAVRNDEAITVTYDVRGAPAATYALSVQGDVSAVSTPLMAEGNTFTIAADSAGNGVRTADFIFTPTGNGYAQPDEEILITVTGVDYAPDRSTSIDAEGLTVEGTATITDAAADAATAELSAETLDIAERDETDASTVLTVRNANPDEYTDVTFTLSTDSATLDTDYTLTITDEDDADVLQPDDSTFDLTAGHRTFRLRMGKTQATFEFEAIADDDEAAEQVVLTITAVSPQNGAAVAIDPDVTTVTIADYDPLPTATLEAVNAQEGGSVGDGAGAFILRLANVPNRVATVAYSVDTTNNYTSTLDGFDDGPLATGANQTLTIPVSAIRNDRTVEAKINIVVTENSISDSTATVQLTVTRITFADVGEGTDIVGGAGEAIMDLSGTDDDGIVTLTLVNAESPTASLRRDGDENLPQSAADDTGKNFFIDVSNIPATGSDLVIPYTLTSRPVGTAAAAQYGDTDTTGGTTDYRIRSSNSNIDVSTPTGNPLTGTITVLEADLALQTVLGPAASGLHTGTLTVYIDPTNDGMGDPDEIVILELTGAGGGTIMPEGLIPNNLSEGMRTVKITEQASATLTAAATNVDEGLSTDVTVTIGRGPLTGAPAATVSFSLGGTATPGVDYSVTLDSTATPNVSGFRTSGNTGSFTINQGATNVEAVLTVAAATEPGTSQSDIDPAETIVITITSVEFSDPASTRVSVLPAPVSIVINNLNAGATLGMINPRTLTEPAPGASAATAMFEVVIDNAPTGGNVTIVLEFDDGAGTATFGGASNLPANGDYSVTATSMPAIVGNITYPLNTNTMSLTTGVTSNGAATVTYVIDITGDTEQDEGSERISVTLMEVTTTAGGSFFIDTSPSELTLVDDDVVVRPSLSDNISIGEKDQGEGTITLNLGGHVSSLGATTVSFTLTVPATAEDDASEIPTPRTGGTDDSPMPALADYSIAVEGNPTGFDIGDFDLSMASGGTVSGMFTLAANVSSARFTFKAIDDDRRESNEVAELTITGLTFALRNDLSIPSITSGPRANVTITEISGDDVMRETEMITHIVGKEQVNLVTGLVRQRVNSLTLGTPQGFSTPGVQVSLAENPETMQDFFSQMALESSGEMDDGGAYSIWARGQYISISGTPDLPGTDNFEYDGTIGGVGMGVERRFSESLLGLSMNFSSADIDSKSSTRAESNYKETMTFFAPYAAWKPDNSRLTLWGAAGAGFGTAEITGEGHAEGNPSVQAFFAQGGVDISDNIGKTAEVVFGLSAVAIEKTVDAFTAGTLSVPETESSVFQGQADFTAYFPVFSDDGQVLRPYVGLASVHDAGDVLNDDRHAMELQTGIAWSNGPWQVSLDTFYQFLRDDEEAWGIFGEAHWTGRGDLDGLLMGMTSGHGTASSMSDAVSSTDSVNSDIDTNLTNADSETAEWSIQTTTEYGFAAPLLDRNGRATPFFRSTHSADARSFVSGVRMDVTDNIGVTAESNRHIPADDDPYSEHAVGLEARWKF